MDILGHSQQWLVCNGRVRFVERIWGITHNSQFFGGLRYGKPWYVVSRVATQVWSSRFDDSTGSKTTLWIQLGLLGLGNHWGLLGLLRIIRIIADYWGCSHLLKCVFFKAPTRTKRPGEQAQHGNIHERRMSLWGMPMNFPWNAQLFWSRGLEVGFTSGAHDCWCPPCPPLLSCWTKTIQFRWLWINTYTYHF